MYHRTWFIVLLLFVSTMLLGGVLFLGDVLTELDFLKAQGAVNTGEAQAQNTPANDATSPHAPSRGNSKAKIQIVEFSDFQCPFCREAFIILQEVWKKYPEDIYFQYRHFPVVSQHPYARAAAEASMCADEQEKFWEYHDLIFKNQQDLSEKTLENFAIILNLDQEKFERCLSTHTYGALVTEDFEAGLRLGVAATPTFFINGYKVQGVLPMEVWEKVIRELR